MRVPLFEDALVVMRRVSKLWFMAPIRREQYENIFKENLDEAVRILKLSDDYIYQQVNDAKTYSKTIIKLFKERKIQILP